MNFLSLLSEANIMSQNLAFAKGSKNLMYGTILGGTVVSVFGEVFATWFGDDNSGQNLELLIQRSTDEIMTGLRELEEALKIKIDRELEGLKADDVQAASRNLAAWTSTIFPEQREAPETLDETTIRLLESHIAEITGSNSHLVNAINFAKRKMTPNYATLPLYLAANLVFLNCIKFFAALSYRVDVQHFLHPPAGQPKPAKPGKDTTTQLFLNEILFKGIKEAVTFAAPMVVDINNAVLKRQKEADAASLTVKLEFHIGSENRFRLRPSVASETSDNGEVGSHQHGYGITARENAEVFAIVKNAQHRSAAWEKATAEGHLELFTIAEIRMLNGTLHTLNRAWQDYHEIMGLKPEDAPPELAGIYPPELVSTIPAELASFLDEQAPEPVEKEPDRPVFHNPKDPASERIGKQGSGPVTFN